MLHDNYHSAVSYCATASGPQHNSHVRPPVVRHLALTSRSEQRQAETESEITRGDTKSDGLEMIFMICCCSDARMLLFCRLSNLFSEREGRAVQLQLIHSDINRLISGQRYNQSSFRFLSLRLALRWALSFVSSSSCWATDD